jgi:hypothetical protein
LIIDRLEAARRPAPHRVLVQAERQGEFFDRVWPVNLYPARVGMPRAHCYAEPFSISLRISAARQTVTRFESFRGWGKCPDWTPAHHVDLLTGIGPRGAKMDASRTNPVSGNSALFAMDRLRLVEDGAVLWGPDRPLADFGLA